MRGPVAITGMACRFPGGADSPERFWKLLVDGVDTVGEVPPSRFDIERFYHSRPATPGRMNSRLGAFLDRIDTFDAAFFGISPREAELLDPQHRLLLEVAWEAFEDAGVPPGDASSDERTGVYIGIMEDAYERILFRDLERVDMFGLSGTGRYAAAGRISHCLRLSGPSLTVDTACSSSVASVHLACQALRAGEATMALAGGAHLLLQPDVSIALAQANMTSRDGRCRFGDANADGFGRGEGVGVVLLEPLERAIARGRKIYAVIRGGALGSFGRTDKAMQRPNADSQMLTLRKAYQDAGVAPADVQYIEAHGTGTRAGDGTELRALAAVLGEARPKESPFLVGSVKTNINHTEGASGIAGLMKLALSLRHRYVPRSLHFETPNPKIDWAGLPVRMAGEGTPWPEPRAGARRIGGVNNFGLSGTNAHLVLEEAPPLPNDVALEKEARGNGAADAVALLPLSAKSPEALVELARAYRPLFEPSACARPSDVARAAATGRLHHAQRLSIVAADGPGFIAGLDAFLRGGAHPGSTSGRSLTSGPEPKLAFVFSGHGSQWLGMGRHLFQTEPAFAEAIEAADEAIRRHGRFSLIDELRADAGSSRLAENEVVQPVLFGVAVGIAALWRAWGIEPDAVIGHSMGEIAAAHVAGAIGIDDAARVVCLRSQLLSRITGKGRMVMVELSADEAREAIAAEGGDLAIAVVQSARTVVLSGARAPLEALVARLESRGVYCRWVKVDYASHGPQIDPLRDDLLALLAPVAPRAARCPIYSTLRGEKIDGAECDARYWFENLREPVQFARGIEQLVSDGHQLFVEISPHSLLLPSIAPALRDGAVVPSFARDTDERTTMLESLGTLYANGRTVAWERVYPPRAADAPAVALPTYPFQRQRYWLPPSPKRHAHAGHPLVGAGMLSALDPRVRLFEAKLDPTVLPYVVDHVVEGAVVMPGSAYIEAAVAAGRAQWLNGTIEVDMIEFEAPLVFVDGEPRVVQTALIRDADDRGTFSVSSRAPNESTWTRHAHGAIAGAATACVPAAGEPLDRVRARMDASLAPEAFYGSLAERGLGYGPAFRGVLALDVGPNEALARIALPEAPARDVGYHLHPALLDIALHTMLAAAPTGGGGPFVPVRLGSMRVHELEAVQRLADAHASDEGLFAHVRVTSVERDAGRKHVRADIRVVDAASRVLLELLGLEAIELEKRLVSEELLFATELSPRCAARASTAPSARGRWLLLPGGPGGSAHSDALRARLEERGEAVVVAGSVDPAAPGAYARLLSDTFPDGSGCRAIVHLATLDLPDEPSPEDLERTLLVGPGSVLHLVQAILATGWRDLPRLHLVTRGAQPSPTSDAPASISGSALLGLGRVLAYEHPELRTTRIDLPAKGDAGDIDSLASVLVDDGAEDEVAARREGIFDVRLVRDRAGIRLPSRLGAAATTSSIVRGDRTYLVTGGLGGLGRTLARWLTGRGAKHVLLVGRTGETGPVAELSSSSASVRFERADVSDRARLAELLAALEVPLGGVFHAAGVLDDGLVIGQSFARFRGVMAPKIIGAWNLHQLTRDLPIDLFVLYASAAGLLGTAGQSGYAAANAFLDGLARYRRSIGLPALSVDWGAFAEVGLAAADENRGERLRAQGLGGLSPAEGTAMLDALVHASTPLPAQIGVLRLDPRQWIEFHPQIAASSYFAGLVDDAVRHGAAKKGAVTERLRGLAPPVRIRALEGLIGDEIAQVLRLDRASLDPDHPLRSSGLDSLMGLQLRNRLEAAFGLTLPATLLWKHPTLRALGAHLSRELFGADEEKAPPNAGAPAASDVDAALEAEVRALSAEAKDALLDELLKDLS